MSQQVFRTSPDGAPSKSVTYVVDATDGNETVPIPLATDTQSNGWPIYDRVTVIKKDVSANTVTIEDATPTTISTLAAQDDSVTLFCDGATWRVESNAGGGDVATHAALTTAHGSVGAVRGATSEAAAIVAGAVAPRITEIHTTGSQDVKVLTFSPGATPATNWWNLAGSKASDPISFSADGTGGPDVGFEFTPKGAGVMTERLIPLAISSEAAQADSTAILLSTLVTDFNLLLAKLRTARVLEP